MNGESIVSVSKIRHITKLIQVLIMSNVIQFSVIAGIEIHTDDQGRFNLNALHHASGLADHKRPSKWLASKQTQELVDELQRQSPNSGLAQKVLNVVKGGTQQGTFAHELIAISGVLQIPSILMFLTV